jgi:hypothetical protein
VVNPGTGSVLKEDKVSCEDLLSQRLAVAGAEMVGSDDIE